MKFPLSAMRYRIGASLVVAVSLLLLPVSAQRPTPQPAPAATSATTPAATTAAEKSPAVTFDTLLSADAYGIYAEVRMVGQQINSPELAELIQPLMHAGGAAGAPDELVEFYDFIKAHAESLTTARLMFAAMPARVGLPDALVAVEMPSIEAAQKFVPELKGFAAAQLAPSGGGGGTNLTLTTNAGDEETPRPAPRRRSRRRTRTGAAGENAAARKLPAAPPFQIKRSGQIIAMSNTAFTFKNLHGKDQALLFNEPGFQAARTRFNADTLFVYFNTVRMNNSTKQRMEAYEKEHRRQEELARIEAEKSGTATNLNTSMAEMGMVGVGETGSMNTNAAAGPGGNMNSANVNVATTPEGELLPPPPPKAASEGTPEATPAPKSEKELEEERRLEQSRQFADRLAQLVFRESPDSSSWPESIGVGASLDGDALVLRGLFVSPSADEPLRPIPFLPVVLSGPSIATEAAAVLPADTDIFASVSLDLPQMYDYLASMIKILDLAAGSEEGKEVGGGFAEQLTTFEKTNNYRIREELLAALGNEIAIGLPGQMFGGRPAAGVPRTETGAPSPPLQTGPIVVIALNDKESLQKLLPRVLASIGFAGASEESIIEKQGDVEMLTFSNGTVAFIDRFLVGAPDAASMRRITEAYNKGETLANSPRFRDPTGWQARQRVGQIYASNTMLKGLFEDVVKARNDIDDPALRAYIDKLELEPGAITHLATREPDGLMHELHLPKNLLSLFMTSQAVSQQLAPMRSNESTAQWKLRMLNDTQNKYKEETGRYVTLEELEAAKPKDTAEYEALEEYSSLEVTGYEIKFSVSGDKFEATATPTGYPKLGRRSFYIDQTGILRGGDTGGKPATASDPEIVGY